MVIKIKIGIHWEGNEDKQEGRDRVIDVYREKQTEIGSGINKEIAIEVGIKGKDWVIDTEQDIGRHTEMEIEMKRETQRSISI